MKNSFNRLSVEDFIRYSNLNFGGHTKERNSLNNK